MKKFIENLKKIFTIKYLLLITTIALFVISVNFTLKTIKNNKIEKLTTSEKVKERKIIDSISKLKIWDTLEYSNVGIDTILLKTKYLNGKLYYKLNLILSAKNSKNYHFVNKLNEFRISFNDIDDFNVYTIILNIFNKIRIIDDNNNMVGIDFEGYEEIEKDTYLKLRSYSIQYKGD